MTQALIQEFNEVLNEIQNRLKVKKLNALHDIENLNKIFSRLNPQEKESINEKLEINDTPINGTIKLPKISFKLSLTISGGTLNCDKIFENIEGSYSIKLMNIKPSLDQGNKLILDNLKGLNTIDLISNVFDILCISNIEADELSINDKSTLTFKITNSTIKTIEIDTGAPFTPPHQKNFIGEQLNINKLNFIDKTYTSLKLLNISGIPKHTTKRILGIPISFTSKTYAEGITVPSLSKGRFKNVKADIFTLNNVGDKAKFDESNIKNIYLMKRIREIFFIKGSLRNVYFSSSIERFLVFEKTNFQKAPLLPSKGVLDNTEHINFSGCSFNEFSKTATGIYRLNKEFFEKRKNEAEKTRFTSLELRSRGAGLKWSVSDFFEKIASIIYYQLNGSGFSLGRPLLWLGGLTFVAFILYWCGDLTTINENFKNYQYKDWILDIKNRGNCGQSLYYSILNSLGPLRLIPMTQVVVAKHWWVQTISFVHGFLSTVLWYLFLMGIKKRFKQN